MFKFTKIIASICLIAFANTAHAQNNANLGLLLEQSGAIGQLESFSPSAAANTSTSIPNAQSSETANASDVMEDEKILLQSEGKIQTETSVVQRYFKILTDKKLEVYGAQEFSQQQDSQLLFFNTVDKNYQLAPGDVINITLRGLKNLDQTFKINKNGNLILPDRQPVNVSGLSISDLEDTLLTFMRYDDASAQVFISLETARLITVQVSGAVNQPRTLAVPAYTPLSRVLAYAGGVKPNGSLRNIVLRGRDGSIEEVDFYDFLQSPAGSNDPVVTDASRIFVPNQGPTVAAFGFVARPGIYELPTDQSILTVQELLTLSGTSIIPPGLVLEAQFFDSNGISKRRKLTFDDTISAGEVLNLRFVQTKLQDTITVTGAVLEEYSMASREPITFSELLKGGATLKSDAKLNFAMLVERDGTAQAVDLAQALRSNSKTIPVGSTLVVLDQSTYLKLVNSEPNKTNDPLTAAVANAELGELFLNGNRIALIPINDKDSFGTILRPNYRTTPRTNLNLAIVETADGNAQAVNLQALLQDNQIFPVTAGLKIHLFETNFLNSFVNRLTNAKDGLLIESDSNQSTPLVRLLSRANVVRINLDDQLVAVLPETSSKKISAIIDTLGLEQSFTDFSDFVELELRSNSDFAEFSSLSLSQNYRSILPAAKTITFWSKTQFTRYLNSLDKRKFTRISSIGVPIFVDNELTDILSPTAFSSKEGVATNLLLDREIYGLFSSVKRYEEVNSSWETTLHKTRNLLFSPTNSNSIEIRTGDEISLFTNQFIDELVQGQQVQSTKTESQKASTLADTRPEYTQAFGSVDLFEQQALEQIQLNVADQSNIVLRDNSNLLRSYSIPINGAVLRPGQYPVAEDIRLSTLINTAGGTLNSADNKRVSVQSIDIQNQSIVKGNVKTYDLDKNDPILAGKYFVEVPYLINEASTGKVTLSGEVLYPGDYVISRNETVHDVLQRAGGLSPVAYPLGAVFSRESLKESEVANNNLLAAELEQSVMQLAGSENPNAADQAQILIGYARQLRTQPTVGRMPVNVIQENKKNLVFMQSGDSLFIPKRPSHVTVMGAVNRKSVVSYAPEKTVESYLFSAGGKTKLADQKSSYVLLPNGEAAQLSRDTIVPPGAVIVIVPRTDRLNVIGLTDLLSRVLGNIATSVLAINNVR